MYNSGNIIINPESNDLEWLNMGYNSNKMCIVNKDHFIYKNNGSYYTYHSNDGG